jgi:spore coat protein JB
MMTNQSYNQFQRNLSYQQGRNNTPCNQQQRPASSCTQPQQRPASSCAQPQQRPTSSCAQPQQRPASSCAQPQQRPVTPCAQPQQRPVTPCAQPQQRPASACTQPQHRPAPPCEQPPQRPMPPRPNPSCPCNQMSREQLYLWITLTKFACVDISLYLDTHPDDREALQYFQEHNRLYNEAMNEYAKTYGPLTISHVRNCDTYWDWVNQPWPWQ